MEIKELIEELFKDRSNEEISAFAYSMGKMIEGIVSARMREISEENKQLKAKILLFRHHLMNRGLVAGNIITMEYDRHFNIVNPK